MVNKPTKFDISKPSEIARLHKELYNYMKISVNDGTDLEGRIYALDALRELVKKGQIQEVR